MVKLCPAPTSQKSSRIGMLRGARCSSIKESSISATSAAKSLRLQLQYGSTNGTGVTGGASYDELQSARERIASIFEGLTRLSRQWRDHSSWSMSDGDESRSSTPQLYDDEDDLDAWALSLSRNPEKQQQVMKESREAVGKLVGAYAAADRSNLMRSLGKWFGKSSDLVEDEDEDLCSRLDETVELDREMAFSMDTVEQQVLDKELQDFQSLNRFYVELNKKSRQQAKHDEEQDPTQTKVKTYDYNSKGGSELFELELELAVLRGQLEEKTQLRDLLLNPKASDEKLFQKLVQQAFERKTAHLLRIVTEQQDKAASLSAQLATNNARIDELKIDQMETEGVLEDDSIGLAALPGNNNDRSCSLLIRSTPLPGNNLSENSSGSRRKLMIENETLKKETEKMNAKITELASRLEDLNKVTSGEMARDIELGSLKKEIDETRKADGEVVEELEEIRRGRREAVAKLEKSIVDVQKQTIEQQSQLAASADKLAHLKIALESAKNEKLERGGRWDSAFADTSTVMKRGTLQAKAEVVFALKESERALRETAARRAEMECALQDADNELEAAQKDLERLEQEQREEELQRAAPELFALTQGIKSGESSSTLDAVLATLSSGLRRHSIIEAVIMNGTSEIETVRDPNNFDDNIDDLGEMSEVLGSFESAVRKRAVAQKSTSVAVQVGRAAVTILRAAERRSSLIKEGTAKYATALANVRNECKDKERVHADAKAAIETETQAVKASLNAVKECKTKLDAIKARVTDSSSQLKNAHLALTSAQELGKDVEGAKKVCEEWRAELERGEQQVIATLRELSIFEHRKEEAEVNVLVAEHNVRVAKLEAARAAYTVARAAEELEFSALAGKAADTDAVVADCLKQLGQAHKRVGDAATIAGMQSGDGRETLHATQAEFEALQKEMGKLNISRVAIKEAEDAVRKARTMAEGQRSEAAEKRISASKNEREARAALKVARANNLSRNVSIQEGHIELAVVRRKVAAAKIDPTVEAPAYSEVQQIERKLADLTYSRPEIEEACVKAEATFMAARKQYSEAKELYEAQFRTLSEDITHVVAERDKSQIAAAEIENHIMKLATNVNHACKKIASSSSTITASSDSSSNIEAAAVELSVANDDALSDLEKKKQAASAETESAISDLRRVEEKRKEVKAAERRGIMAMERAAKAKQSATAMADKVKKKKRQLANAKSACEVRRAAERSARQRLAAAASIGEEDLTETEAALREIESSRKNAELAVLQAEDGVRTAQKDLAESTVAADQMQSEAHAATLTARSATGDLATAEMDAQSATLRLSVAECKSIAATSNIKLANAKSILAQIVKHDGAMLPHVRTALAAANALQIEIDAIEENVLEATRNASQASRRGSIAAVSGGGDDSIHDDTLRLLVDPAVAETALQAAMQSVTKLKDSQKKLAERASGTLATVTRLARQLGVGDQQSLSHSQLHSTDAYTTKNARCVDEDLSVESRELFSQARQRIAIARKLRSEKSSELQRTIQHQAALEQQAKANAMQLGELSRVEHDMLDAIARTRQENTAKVAECAELEIKLRGARTELSELLESAVQADFELNLENVADVNIELRDDLLRTQRELEALAPDIAKERERARISAETAKRKPRLDPVSLERMRSQHERNLNSMKDLETKIRSKQRELRKRDPGPKFVKEARALFEENSELRGKLKRLTEIANKNAAGRKQNKEIVKLREVAEKYRITVDSLEARLEEIVKAGELARGVGKKGNGPPKRQLTDDELELQKRVRAMRKQCAWWRQRWKKKQEQIQAATWREETLITTRTTSIGGENAGGLVNPPFHRDAPQGTPSISGRSTSMTSPSTALRSLGNVEKGTSLLTKSRRHSAFPAAPGTGARAFSTPAHEAFGPALHRVPSAMAVKHDPPNARSVIMVINNNPNNQLVAHASHTMIAEGKLPSSISEPRPPKYAQRRPSLTSTAGTRAPMERSLGRRGLQRKLSSKISMEAQNGANPAQRNSFAYRTALFNSQHPRTGRSVEVPGLRGSVDVTSLRQALQQASVG